MSDPYPPCRIQCDVAVLWAGGTWSSRPQDVTYGEPLSVVLAKNRWPEDFAQFVLDAVDDDIRTGVETRQPITAVVLRETLHQIEGETR